MKLKSKNHFFFGFKKEFNVARVFLRRTYTNIFITLTDLHDKVIVCKTSGNRALRGLSVVKKHLRQLKILYWIYKVF